MTLHGIYFGNDTKSLKTAETWLGKSVDMVAGYISRTDWPSTVSGISWAIKNFKNVSATIRWSVPLIAEGANLKDAANHAYDSYYIAQAKLFAAAYPQQKEIIIRMGEEFNGSWFPWAAKGKEADFAQTYRNFVDAYRSVSDKFRFEWNVANGTTGTDVAAAYPGDAYVDYIGSDFYWDGAAAWPKDPVQAFNWKRDRPFGLQWVEDFAAAHGKQTAYSEWGVNSDNGGDYLKLVAEWFASHNVAYETYWDSNSGFTSKLSGGLHGTTSDVFREIFGVDGTLYAKQSITLPSSNAALILSGTASIDGTGNAAANTLIGNDAVNTLSGLAGDDILDGGKGNDVLIGGAGADIFTFAPGNGQDVITDFALNGEADKIDLSEQIANGSTPILSNVGADALISFASGDSITVCGIKAENLVAATAGYEFKPAFLPTGKEDQVTHQIAPNSRTIDKIGTSGDKDWFTIDLAQSQNMKLAVEGWGANQGTLVDSFLQIYDNRGNLIASDNNNGTFADSYINFVAPSDGRYYLVVKSNQANGKGSYTLEASSGSMVFDLYNHKLQGSAADDQIFFSSRWNDTMSGGAGADTFTFGVGSGADVIRDFGFGGNDALNLGTYLEAGYTPTVSQSGKDTLVSLSGASSIRLVGVSATDLLRTTYGFAHA